MLSNNADAAVVADQPVEPRVIKRRRKSTHLVKNWWPLYQRYLAKRKARFKNPVKCKRCGSWREITDYRSRLVSGRMIRCSHCRRCERQLAEAARAKLKVLGATQDSRSCKSEVLNYSEVASPAV